MIETLYESKGTPSPIDDILGSEIDGQLDPGLAEVEGVDVGFSINLIYKNFIGGQIKTPFGAIDSGSRPRDFLSVLMDKIALLRLKSYGDEERVDKLDNIRRSVFLEMVESFQDQYGFDISEECSRTADDLTTDELANLAHALYSFLVVERVENTTAVITGYVADNRKSLVAEMKPRIGDRKNFSLSSIKTALKNYDDIVIVYSLPDIVASLQHAPITFGDLVKFVEEYDEGEVSIGVLKKFISADDEIFVRKMLEPISTDELNGFFSREVKMAMLPSLQKKEG